MKQVEKFEQDLQLVSKVVKDQPAFLEILGHPSVETSEKKNMIENVFRKSIHEVVLNTLKLLCERRRAMVIPELVNDFSHIAGKELGQVDAHVTSAFALNKEHLDDIQKTFTGILAKQVRLASSTVDKELIGGIQVRIGDTLYDGSIAGKLARLGKSLQERKAL